MTDYGNNIGPRLLLLICCIWPLIVSGLTLWIYRRFQSRGLLGFIPRLRRQTKEQHKP